ncbi:hypothetical protein PRIPAC_85930 [Pristionchus pacificus]|uniref:Uncharacterized protein n=1 Tax=Pristionchus pacificus TaxID=54126 RepID=A0A2A6BUP7_PRIPA|nr:hypothetical protein PRIPAC_85930 [Pristionchus pacificus]|eukprot:PDM69640.1 hypothetical protein PRIPAC_44736 [Pristionchus pacificus]
MGSTAHFIDSEWKRQLYIISLDSVQGPHNGNQYNFDADGHNIYESGTNFLNKLALIKCTRDTISVDFYEQDYDKLMITHVFMMYSHSGFSNISKGLGFTAVMTVAER